MSKILKIDSCQECRSFAPEDVNGPNFCSLIKEDIENVYHPPVKCPWIDVKEGKIYVFKIINGILIKE